MCRKDSITVPADAEGSNWRLSKYRQDVRYLDTSWINSYRPIRSHGEGADGRFKSDRIDMGNPEPRPAPAGSPRPFSSPSCSRSPT